MTSRECKYILAKYDVSGIQDYIFATNRLQENAGASYQVTRILEEFLVEAFREAADQENAEIILDWKNEDKLCIPEDENIKAEIIYIGGGNAVALFRSRKLFRKTGEMLSVKAAVHCQGLSLAAAYIETDLLDFAKDRNRLDQRMDRMKRSMARQPLHSPFPVIEQDPLSYHPITCCIRHGEDVENVTGVQFQKRGAYRKIRSYQRIFPSMGDGASYQYPKEMDQLCREHGEDSQVAIVHIDGNGMGERINRKLQEHRNYTEGVPAIRKESREIAKLFQDTYAEVLKTLWDEQVFISCGRQEGEKEAEKIKIFPLRPIILDGDDFTFLCRAELAVPFAAGFIRRLMQKQGEEKQKITACGGIAFVHSHFPFRVAYSIAEESCARAKETWYLKKRLTGGVAESGYLDFQMIKESELEIQEKNTKRKKCPYAIALEDSKVNGVSLRMLYRTLKKMEDWPSGRLHKIYRAIQEGNGAMELLKREFASRGYEIDDLTQGNLQDSRLLDALELRGMCRMDLLEKFLNIQGGQIDGEMEAAD